MSRTMPKIFVACSVIGGSFVENIETTECRYFAEDELPTLATEKNSVEQIKMCFNAHLVGDNWHAIFD